VIATVLAVLSTLGALFIWFIHSEEQCSVMQENHHFLTVRRFWGIVLGLLLGSTVIGTLMSCGMSEMWALLYALGSVVVPAFLFMFSAFKVDNKYQGALNETIKGILVLTGIGLSVYLGGEDIRFITDAGMSRNGLWLCMGVYAMGMVLIWDWLWMTPNRRAQH
jgi:hypothetical protein